MPSTNVRFKMRLSRYHYSPQRLSAYTVSNSTDSSLLGWFLIYCDCFAHLVPPETVKISVAPKNLVPGIRAKLICDSSSSNPPAKISWWKDGIPVEGLNLANRPGLWGGSVSTLEMHVNITQDLDGSIYTCQSHNEVLQRSVHETISLDILCKCLPAIQ